MKKPFTKKKAKTILKEKKPTLKGKPITKKQRGLLGLIAGGKTPTKLKTMPKKKLVKRQKRDIEKKETKKMEKKEHKGGRGEKRELHAMPKKKLTPKPKRKLVRK